MYIFKPHTDSLVEMILCWTRCISDQTSGKTFIRKDHDIKNLCDS